ncbi:hypothetical protein [Acidocella sp.]|uniref:hypothetical protein n=1 Tax=Acidocella sp. TaxID=50710 RepID=UPI0026288E16|nr:hypothetical protein [Acidocella sp.]
MRGSALFSLYLIILLTGCAAQHPVVQDKATSLAYVAKVLAVRQVSGGPALSQVMQALGEPGVEQGATGEEIVVQTRDGAVKSLVPPPGTPSAALIPGAEVLISEMPQLRIVIR